MASGEIKALRLVEVVLFCFNNNNIVINNLTLLHSYFIPNNNINLDAIPSNPTLILGKLHLISLCVLCGFKVWQTDMTSLRHAKPNTKTCNLQLYLNKVVLLGIRRLSLFLAEEIRTTTKSNMESNSGNLRSTDNYKMNWYNCRVEMVSNCLCCSYRNSFSVDLSRRKNWPLASCQILKKTWLRS